MENISILIQNTEPILFGIIYYLAVTFILQY